MRRDRGISSSFVSSFSNKFSLLRNRSISKTVSFLRALSPCWVLLLGIWIGLLLGSIFFCNQSINQSPNESALLKPTQLTPTNFVQFQEVQFYSGCSSTIFSAENRQISSTTGKRNSSILLFLHIQKVGGTSLWKALEQLLPVGGSYSYKPFKNHQYWFPWELESDRYRRLRNFDAIFGHYMFGIHNALDPKRGHCYVTMLRNPVDRLLSLWRFLKVEYTSQLPRKKGDEVIDVLDFFNSSSPFSPSFQYQNKDNGMVRALCGPEAYIVPFGSLTQYHLHCAKRNLVQHFGVILITEEFESSLALLEKVLGFTPNTLPRLRENVTQFLNKSASVNTTLLPPGRKKEEEEKEKGLDEQSKRKLVRSIEEMNQLDLELYSFALELFHKTTVSLKL